LNVVRHGFVFKRHLRGWREGGVFKLHLTSTPKRCETYWVNQNKKAHMQDKTNWAAEKDRKLDLHD